MWIKFDLDGMKLQLKVNGYKPDQTSAGEWAKVSYDFEFQNVIKYKSHYPDEILLSSEIDYLRDTMEKVINNKLDETIDYECIEPDFEFIFAPSEENSEYDMELKVHLWNSGLTCNYFSMIFGKEHIKQLFLYFSLISRKITKEDPEIKELIAKGIINEE